MTKAIMTRLAAFLTAIILFNGFAAICTAAEDDDAGSDIQVIEGFHDTLMEIMQNGGSLGYQGRFEILAKVIPASFNVPMISQVILGRHWGNLDDGQKDEFIALYEKLITATYASQFDDYDGETFTFKNDEELGRGRKLIKTELHTGDGEVVNLDYLMSEHNGRWLIISVIANGANDISIKRGEYADVIKNRGYPALLNEIRKKITEMSA